MGSKQPVWGQITRQVSFLIGCSNTYGVFHGSTQKLKKPLYFGTFHTYQAGFFHSYVIEILLGQSFLVTSYLHIELKLEECSKVMVKQRIPMQQRELPGVIHNHSGYGQGCEEHHAFSGPPMEGSHYHMHMKCRLHFQDLCERPIPYIFPP